MGGVSGIGGSGEENKDLALPVGVSSANGDEVSGDELLLEAEIVVEDWDEEEEELLGGV